MTTELTAQEYEREAKATRHRLARSLDELNDRLTPGQVFDEVLTYARGGSGTFYRALSNAARDNPVPSLLIGAGCLLFLSDKLGLSGYMARAREAGSDGASMGARAAESMSEAAGSAGSAAGQAAQAASSSAQSAAQSIRSGAQSATG